MSDSNQATPGKADDTSYQRVAFALMAAFFAIEPFAGVYPVFLM